MQLFSKIFAFFRIFIVKNLFEIIQLYYISEYRFVLLQYL
jgi:hypothetical protein